MVSAGSSVVIQCQYPSDDQKPVDTVELTHLLETFGPLLRTIETKIVEGVPFYVARYDHEEYATYAVENLNNFTMNKILLKVKKLAE